MTGVAIGVGMSSTQDIADAGVLVSQVVPHLASACRVLGCCKRHERLSCHVCAAVLLLPMACKYAQKGQHMCRITCVVMST